MPIGSAYRFADTEQGNLIALNVNTLDAGCNVYRDVLATSLLINISPGRFTSSLGLIDFPGQLGALMPVSTLAQKVWIDPSAPGAIMQGAAFPVSEHLPLAEVDTSANDVIAIRDLRPRVGGTIVAAGAPAGPAGGDLAGAYPNPTVASVGGQTAATIGAHVAPAGGNPHGVTATDAGAIPVAEKAAANGVASLNGASLVVQEPATKGLVNGVASLNGSTLVVQNPANAQTTPAAAKIPISDGAGKIDTWVTAQAAFLKRDFVASGDPGVAGTRLLYPKGAAFVVGGTIQYMQVFLPVTSFDFMRTFLDSGGVNGESIRMGIYDQLVPTDPGGAPNARLGETAVRVLNAGDNSTFVTEALGAPVVIATAGFYWIALICSGILSVFAASETSPAGYLARREEVSAGVTLPAAAGALTNPASAAIFSAARRP